MAAGLGSERSVSIVGWKHGAEVAIFQSAFWPHQRQVPQLLLSRLILRDANGSDGCQREDFERIWNPCSRTAPVVDFQYAIFRSEPPVGFG